MSANDIGQQAAGQAGGAAKKAGSKVASKAVGKAGKYLKKLLMKFLKQLVVSLGKIIISLIGPWGLAIVAAIIIILLVLFAIPDADWFLGGNARSEAQKNADLKYEQEFKDAANETVEELWVIEADQLWKSQLIKTVRPSWGIPAALVRYEILINEKMVQLTDYKPRDLIKHFRPSYKYTKIKDDKDRTRIVETCVFKKEDGSTEVITTTTIHEETRPAHDVLSNVSFDYANMDIQPLKWYYPGPNSVPKTDPNTWQVVKRERSGDCTITTYFQYEHTTVDDRYAPSLVIDVPKFQNILINELGVDEEDLKVFYEFVQTADPDWNASLYGGKNSKMSMAWPPGSANVPDVVLRYEPLVRKYLEAKGLGDLTQLVLALIMQETGGRYLDVMQSSESLGLPPNTITDPELSIKVGIDHFAAVYASAGGDIPLTLQAYNFGGGFISYAKERGGYSKEIALEYSKMMAEKQGWKRYGDPDYVDHVMRYYNATSTPIQVASGEQIFDVQAALDIMSRYLGQPYYWGGKSPNVGFDCSGLLAYAFGQLGIDLSGNAHTQYNKTVPIRASEAKPGDLVFWETYKKAPSHVGMYLGNGKFINSGSSRGVNIDTLDRWKNYKFLGFRRIVSK